MARQVRPEIAALESLNTLLGCWGVKVPPVKENVGGRLRRQFPLQRAHLGREFALLLAAALRREVEEAESAGKYEYAEESWKEHRRLHFERADWT